MAKLTIFEVKDVYNRRARLQPAFIVALPLGLTILAWSPDGLKGWTVLWTLFVWAGGTALLTHLARDLGKRKEPSLFQEWGGKPSTRMLRYADCENEVLVARRHDSLQKALPDLRIPTKAEELSDPKRSDDIYDVSVKWLLEKTRDKKKFPLVFEENCNYGFRRNLWGMRAWGILLSGMGLGAGVAAGVFRSSRSEVPLVSYGAIACIACLLLFWLLICNAAWVKLAADAFAERLLASTDIIVKNSEAKPKPRVSGNPRVTRPKTKAAGKKQAED
jgi:hypothetical protein